jgi:hypothetical protein
MKIVRLFLVLVAATSLVAGGVVLAAGRTEVVKLPPVYATEAVAQCDGFMVIESFYAEVKVIAQYDKDGNLVKVNQHGSTGGRSTFFNSVNPEISVTGGPEQNVTRSDFEKMTFKVSGLNYKVTIPGVGMVFHQGGHYTCNMLTGEWTQVGGPNDWLSGDVDALCAALAP